MVYFLIALIVAALAWAAYDTFFKSKGCSCENCESCEHEETKEDKTN